jgi:hypothetical protein
MPLTKQSLMKALAWTSWNGSLSLRTAKTLPTRTDGLLSMFGMTVESLMAADSLLILLPRQASTCGIHQMTNRIPILFVSDVRTSLSESHTELGTFPIQPPRVQEFSHYRYSSALRRQSYRIRSEKLCWKSEILPVHHPEVIHDVAGIHGAEIEYPIVWFEFVITTGCPYEKCVSSQRW